MKLRVLRYFVAIADAGSVTAAASHVCVAQSALSRHIRELEADLGVTLMQRSSQGIRLTAAGVMLYESAKRMLGEAGRVRDQLANRSSSSETTITLGISPTLGSVLVPGLFERCRLAPADITLTVREAFTPMLLDWLHRGLIDMAITTNPTTDKPVSLHPLLGEPFALACPASQQRSLVVSPEQLSDIPVLMTNLHRGIVERQLGLLGARLNVQAEIDSVDAIRQLVLQGSCATIMPVSVFAADPKSLRTVTLSEVSGIPLNRILTLATRTEPRPAAGIAIMKDMVEAELVALAGRGVFSLAPHRGPKRM